VYALFSQQGFDSFADSSNTNKKDNIMASSVSSRRPQLSSRIVLAFFMVATVLTALLFTKLMAAIFMMAGIKDPAVLGRDFTNSTMIALGMTVAGLFYTLRATVAYPFVKQVAEELVKVTWPSFEESKQNTSSTVWVTAVIAIILFVFDWAFGNLTDLLLAM
jgi:preprotein translocase subunit SecE